MTVCPAEYDDGEHLWACQIDEGHLGHHCHISGDWEMWWRDGHPATWIYRPKVRKR